ncbi:MAG: site-specific DNA-methyltransferase [Kosmotogaceae bacterium]|nr:site-specific DNA-methyltransferase [Kosmotogaceae bacterium]
MNIYTGDALGILKTMGTESVHCCVTSPPYWGLRDYGVNGQLGLEKTPEAYVERLVTIFAEVRRVLRSDGTLWLNLGDSYASGGNGWRSSDSQSSTLNGGKPHNILNRNGCPVTSGMKPKDLVGIPWMVAFALRADGWYLRSDIIWHKPNPMPESVTDRPTKSHEYIFLLSKSERYFYDAAAIAEPVKALWGTRDRTHGKYHNKGSGLTPHSGLEKEYLTANKRSVWNITSQPYKEAHFATFPPELPRLCILAGCPEGGTVLDPFNGVGTTGLVALRLGREYIGIELNPEYVEMSQRRIVNDAPLFNKIDDRQQNNVLQPTTRGGRETPSLPFSPVAPAPCGG